jgi:hypothetical protein
VPHVAATAREPEPYVWAAGIQLRVLPNLWAFFDAVVASLLEFSCIRLHLARPRTSPGGA